MNTKTSTEQWKQFQEIVARAKGDTVFKKRLLAEPETVVREHGLEVPNGVHFELTEKADQTLEMSFWKDSDAGELSLEELQKASGGTWECTTKKDVQTKNGQFVITTTTTCEGDTPPTHPYIGW